MTGSEAVLAFFCAGRVILYRPDKARFVAAKKKKVRQNYRAKSRSACCIMYRALSGHYGDSIVRTRPVGVRAHPIPLAGRKAPSAVSHGLWEIKP